MDNDNSVSQPLIPVQLKSFVFPIPVNVYEVKRTIRMKQYQYKKQCDNGLFDDFDFTSYDPCFKVDYGSIDDSKIEVIGCEDLLFDATLKNLCSTQFKYKRFRFCAKTFLRKMCKKYNIRMSELVVEYPEVKTEKNSSNKKRPRNRNFKPVIIPVHIIPFLLLEMFLYASIAKTIIFSPLIITFQKLLTQFQGNSANFQLKVALYNMITVNVLFQRKYVIEEFANPTLDYLSAPEDKKSNMKIVKKRKLAHNNDNDDGKREKLAVKCHYFTKYDDEDDNSSDTYSKTLGDSDSVSDSDSYE